MEDFPDLHSYNDYLEEVEDIGMFRAGGTRLLSDTVLAFNLINDIDVAETEARIAKYKQENAALIELNVQREEQYAQYLREQEEAERLEREQSAMELRRLEEQEREEREKGRQELIDKLETSTKDAAKLVAKSKAEAQKRASARAATSSFTSSSKLLRNRAKGVVVPDVPHVPIQDDWYAYEDKFTLRDTYDDPVSEAVRRDREGIMRAGGYRVEEAWERAIRFAVADLDLAPLQGLHPTAKSTAQISISDPDVIMGNV